MNIALLNKSKLSFLKSFPNALEKTYIDVTYIQAFLYFLLCELIAFSVLIGFDLAADMQISDTVAVNVLAGIYSLYAVNIWIIHWVDWRIQKRKTLETAT